MLFLGQLIAFAPAHGATMNGSGHPVAVSVMAQVAYSPTMSTSDHQDHAMHHTAGAHCIGCGIVAPLYGFQAPSVEHVKAVPFIQMLAHSVELPHFRPPIAPLD